jgi:heat shock protein HtpX
MATSVIGLKTHIWNNNLKSLLFLLLYPLIVSFIYAGVAYVLMIFFFDSTSSEWKSTFKYIIASYWFIPHILLIIYLFIVYKFHMNRLDIPEGKYLVTREKYPEVYSILEELCISRGLNMPYLFILKHPSLNAYTAGISKHTYYIVVTSGLLERLSKDEFETVLAHELTHIVNGDTRLLFLTGTITNVTREIAKFFTPEMVDEADTDEIYFWEKSQHSGWKHGGLTPFFIALMVVFKLGNLGALFTQMLISRKREYMADAGAIELTKNPEHLISALRKISKKFRINDNPIRRPLYTHYESQFDYFRTHPTIEERVKAIEFTNRIKTDEFGQLIDEASLQKTANNKQPNIW